MYTNNALALVAVTALTFGACAFADEAKETRSVEMEIKVECEEGKVDEVTERMKKDAQRLSNQYKNKDEVESVETSITAEEDDQEESCCSAE